MFNIGAFIINSFFVSLLPYLHSVFIFFIPSAGNGGHTSISRHAPDFSASLQESLIS
jgi:hypothetical protein